MALVAGVVFFIVRAGLALIPGFSSRHPTKKWGAIAALVAATLYLALSGAEVATQRSYVMTAVVLVGVLADRAALTLRTLAVAAFAVLLLTPESVAHPSFQMSFAATLALVAAYQGGLPWAGGRPDTSLGAKVALWGGREVAALLFASVVAGFATTPYAAFHFHRVAPYGVIANLLAMPVVSVLVMPAGLIALIAMPFGLDGPLWRLMGFGIDWMIAVASWVASLPGAVGRVTAFGVGALIVMTAGMIVLCLMRTRVRYAGVAIFLAGCAMAFFTTRPDVLISAGGDVVAVRTAGGKLSVLKFGGSTFTINDWLGGDADLRTSADKALSDGFACDENGCTARLADNTIVAVSRTAAAISEDCRAASLVITARDASPGCEATIIDRKLLRARGAQDLQRVGERWQIVSARPMGTDRPWARATAEETPSTPRRSTARDAAPRDATPRAEDLEADD